MSFPFIATIIFLSGMIALAYVLLTSIWRSRSRTLNNSPKLEGFTDDFGPSLTSHRLRRLRWAVGLLALTTLVFHIYWGLFAAGPIAENQDFALLKNRRDQRHRRETESHLRGWIFDRHHDARRALAKYRYLNGQVIRDYPLGYNAAHLIGYSGLLRGDVMIERAVATGAIDPATAERSWWSKWFSLEGQEKKVIGRDLILTVDFDLQKEAAAQLAGKSGAIVMLNPQTGELLALASAPSFDSDDINNDEKWSRISRDIKNRPLLNRALNEYYLPGSTLKVLTASAAIEAHLDQRAYSCRSVGWIPPGSTRPIRDDEGEEHGQITLTEAFVHSCNQYFAQLGIEIDRIRLSEAASRFGLRVFDDAASSLRAGTFRNLWSSDNPIISDVLAPFYSTYVVGRRTTKYDLALEAIGQGYVQLTPIQMAMIVSAVANLQGNVIRPMIEMNRQPAVLSQAMTPETAARLRSMMAAVVERGTASTAFASVRNRLTAGGKTGTAQREVPVIDPRTGQSVTYRDSRGVEHIKRTLRLDSWFIGFAPVNRPRIAIAVVVEGGGYGGRTAAPIAATLLEKAQRLGLLNSLTPDSAVESR